MSVYSVYQMLNERHKRFRHDSWQLHVNIYPYGQTAVMKGDLEMLLFRRDGYLVVSSINIHDIWLITR